MTLSEILEQLGAIKLQANDLYVRYKELKEQEDHLKEQLMFTLKEVGLKSAKGQDFTASIAERTDVVVAHESTVMEWLQNEPNVEADAYIGIKTTAFKSFANGWLKKTGEIIPGADVVVSESITIKKNKEK